MWTRHLIVLLQVCAVVVALVAPDSRSAGAQPGSREALGLSQVLRLYAPASGALFAATTTGLFRSDDAGPSWFEIAHPGGSVDQEHIVVDPLNHRVIYLPGEQSLDKTDDEAVTWNRIARIVPMPAIHRIPNSPARRTTSTS
jgi:hypothetical protein